MRILALETTCDDTGVALVEFQRKRMQILFNFLLSQNKIHQKFGGVVPHLASQKHRLNLKKGLERLKKKRGSKNWEELFDYLAFANQPGLMPSLLVGKEMAQTLSLLFNKPIIPLNHIRAHLYSPLIKAKVDLEERLTRVKFPLLCLTVSGGHTMLVLIRDYFQEKVLGKTLDDAAGEAFDKVARMLGLSYPGGAALEELAQKGNPKRFTFPRPMASSQDYNFSFAGLKTAVLYKIKKLKSIKKYRADLAASFQEAIVDILVQKTVRAAREYGAKLVFLTGGVANNRSLEKSLKQSLEKNKKSPNLLLPPPSLRQDNAVMIGFLAYLKIRQATSKRQRIGIDWKDLEVETKVGIN